MRSRRIYALSILLNSYLVRRSFDSSSSLLRVAQDDALNLMKLPEDGRPYTAIAQMLTGTLRRFFSLYSSSVARRVLATTSPPSGKQ